LKVSDAHPEEFGFDQEQVFALVGTLPFTLLQTPASLIKPQQTTSTTPSLTSADDM
jgi:hypothetical protein